MPHILNPHISACSKEQPAKRWMRRWWHGKAWNFMAIVLWHGRGWNFIAIMAWHGKSLLPWWPPTSGPVWRGSRSCLRWGRCRWKILKMPENTEEMKGQKISMRRWLQWQFLDAHEDKGNAKDEDCANADEANAKDEDDDDDAMLSPPGPGTWSCRRWTSPTARRAWWGHYNRPPISCPLFLNECKWG